MRCANCNACRTHVTPNREDGQHSSQMFISKFPRRWARRNAPCACLWFPAPVNAKEKKHSTKKKTAAMERSSREGRRILGPSRPTAAATNRSLPAWPAEVNRLRLEFRLLERRVEAQITIMQESIENLASILDATSANNRQRFEACEKRIAGLEQTLYTLPETFATAANHTQKQMQRSTPR